MTAKAEKKSFSEERGTSYQTTMVVDKDSGDIRMDVPPPDENFKMSTSIFDASILLPGLKLKEINRTSISPGEGGDQGNESPLLVYLKQFDDDFKVFLGGTTRLVVRYSGGIRSFDASGGGEGEVEKKNEESEEEEVEMVTEVCDATEIPGMEGYHCFRLYPNKAWTSSTKGIQTISLDLIVSENGSDIFSRENNNKVVNVGESFVIDLDAANSTMKEAYFFEWDLSNTLMRQVFSPERTAELLKVESGIPSDALLLGVAGTRKFDPFKPLSLHVHLHDDVTRSGELTDLQNFKIKIYGGVDSAVPTVKKTFDDVVEDGIAKAVASGSLFLEDMITTSSAATSTTGDFLKIELNADTFLSMVQSTSAGDRDSYGSDYTSILEEKFASIDEKVLRSVLTAINKARFYVLIEDSKGLCVAKFLLSDIKANDLYFDSAVRTLMDRNNWDEEKLVDWSNMAVLSSQTLWNSIEESSITYKVTRGESVRLAEATDDKSLQKFEVKLELPKIVSSGSTSLDPNDIAILIENDDPDLKFTGKESSKNRFHYITDPAEDISISEGGDMLRFEWLCVDTGSAPRDSRVTISVLLKPTPTDKTRKIGSSVSFPKRVGEGSMHHSTGMKLRNMVGLGLADASTLEYSITQFLDALFRLVFDFADIEKEGISTSLVYKAADDVSETYYNKMMGKDNSTAKIYEEIMKSTIFSSGLVENFSATAIGDSQIVVVVGEIFAVLAKESDELDRWAASLLNDEDFVNAMEYQNEDTKEERINKYRSTFAQVLAMDSSEISEQLQKHPSTKDSFISAGRILRTEIEESIDVDPASKEFVSFLPANIKKSSPTINSTEDQKLESIHTSLLAAGVNVTKKDLKTVMAISATDSLKEIEVKSREISTDIERELSTAAFVTKGMGLSTATDLDQVSAMETTLVTMLETAKGSCKTNLSMIDDAQSLMDDLLSPLEKLEGLSSDITDISSKSTKLYGAIDKFWKLAQALSKVAFGPLAPLKGIVKGMKIPMNLLLKVLKKGKESIKSIESRFNSKLKSLAKSSTRRRIGSVSETLDKPKPALEKFAEVIASIISVSSFGIVPMSMVSKFASSTDLADFFQTLKDNVDGVKSVFGTLFEQANRITPYVNKVKDLAKDVQSKFSILAPVDKALQSLKPLVDAINGVYNMFPSWMTWAIEKAMWPIEQAVNLILYPFRDSIQGVIRQLNPFSSFDDIFNPILKPLNLLPSFYSLTAELNFAETLQNSSAFSNVVDSITSVVAIILRGLFGVLSGMLEQTSASIELFENMLTSDVLNGMKSLLSEKREVDPFFRMGDLILDMKNDYVDGISIKCDSYLRMHTSSSPFSYVDSSIDSKMRQYLESRTDYELVPCEIDVVKDSETPFFKRGSASNTWLMAPLAAILHYARITQQAAAVGAIPVDDEIRAKFIPVVESNGKCTVMLFPRVSNNAGTMYTTDTRLPIEEATLSISDNSDVGSMPEMLIDYVQKRITSPVLSVFADKYSWAMIEKIAACKLNVSNWDSETVGTGMHLLSGNTNGVRYLKKNGTHRWMKDSILNVSTNGNSYYDRVGSRRTAASFEEKQLVELLKARTLSMKHVEVLDSLQGNNGVTEKEDDVTEIQEAIRNGLSMFVVTFANGVSYPILYTDDTAEEYLVYLDGMKIQPLLNLTNVNEIWEYKIAGHSTTITPEEPEIPVRPLNSVSKSSWFSDKNSTQWLDICESENVEVVKNASSSKLNVSFRFKDQGSGNRKGRVDLKLVDSTGSTLYNVNVGGTADHSYRNVSAEFGADHDLVRRCEPGCKYVLSVYVGHGGGHKLWVKNIEIRFERFGYVYIVTTDLSRSYIPAQLEVKVITSTSRVVQMMPENSFRISRVQIKNARAPPISIAAVSPNIQNIQNRLFRPAAFIPGGNNATVGAMTELIQNAGAMLVRKKEIQLNDIIIFYQMRNGRRKEEYGEVRNVDRNRNEIQQYSVFNFRLEREFWVTPKDVKRKLTQVEEQTAENLRRRRIFFDVTDARQRKQWPRTNEDDFKARVPDWGMTLAQFRQYVHHCMGYDSDFRRPSSSLWYKQAYKFDELLGRPKGYVDLEDMNTAFIKKQTVGSGMSVALNMQEGNTHMRTHVMVSHAWREDMEQVLAILEAAKGTRLRRGGTFNDNTVIWFCAFSQFQPNDGGHDGSTGKPKADQEGPTVSEQVELDPFARVIENVKDMFVIQTKTFDPYSRMWCVIELGEALKLQERDTLKIHPLFSKEWLAHYITHTGPLLKTWAFVGEEWIYRSGRPESSDRDQVELLRRGAGANRARNNIRQYYLMTADEQGQDPTNNNAAEPKLKTNVREGLTYYGQYTGIRPSDQNVFDDIARRFETTRNNRDGWERLQRVIVNFQEEAALNVYEKYRNQL